jgi:hypothetical protein
MKGVETLLPPDMISSAAPNGASSVAVQEPAISLNRFAP